MLFSTQAPPNPMRIQSALLIAVGVAAIVAAARLFLVVHYGTSNPFLDQWDAEVEYLYRPYVQGTLSFPDFFQPHNEHRIALTRLIGLGLFMLNGNQFDAKVEMMFNIVLYLAVVIVFMHSATRLVPRRSSLLFVVVALLGFSLPLGWENLIAGFQNQFYLLILCALIALRIAVSIRIDAKSAVALLLLAALANVTVASGALLSLFLAGVLATRTIATPRRRGTAIVLIAMLLAIFAVAMATMPQVEHHTGLRAQAAGELIRAFGVVLAWPMRPRSIALGAVAASLMYLPTVFAAIGMATRMIRRQSLQPGTLYLLAVSGWCLLQGIAVAYSRGHEMFGMSSRYVDIFVLGVLVNVILALRMTRAHTTRRVWRASGVMYALAIAMALLAQLPQSLEMMQDRRAYGERQAAYVRAYLENGDRAQLAAAREANAFPDTPRLIRLLDDPKIVSLLPATMARPLAIQWERCQVLVPLAAVAAQDRIPSAPSQASWRFQSNLGGECLSQPFTVSRTHVLDHFIGFINPREGQEYVLIGQNGERHPLVVFGPSVNRWRPATARVAPGTYRLNVANATADTLFAFTAPVETGRLTAFSYSLDKRVWTCTALLLLLGLAAFSTAVARDADGARRRTATV